MKHLPLRLATTLAAAFGYGLSRHCETVSTVGEDGWLSVQVVGIGWRLTRPVTA